MTDDDLVSAAAFNSLVPLGETLTSFKISSPFPFALDYKGLSVFLPKLHNLQSLYLNPSFVVNDENLMQGSLRAEILESIAEWCPNLRELGIFLDCVEFNFDFNQESSHSLDLTSLNLGISRIEPSDSRLAYLLSFFCAPACVFKGARDLWTAQMLAKVLEEDEDYLVNTWDYEGERIRDLVRFFRKLRSERKSMADQILATAERLAIMTVECEMFLQRQRRLE